MSSTPQEFFSHPSETLQYIKDSDIPKLAASQRLFGRKTNTMLQVLGHLRYLRDNDFSAYEDFRFALRQKDMHEEDLLSVNFVGSLLELFVYVLRDIDSTKSHKNKRSQMIKFCTQWVCPARNYRCPLEVHQSVIVLQKDTDLAHLAHSSNSSESYHGMLATAASSTKGPGELFPSLFHAESAFGAQLKPPLPSSMTVNTGSSPEKGYRFCSTCQCGMCHKDITPDDSQYQGSAFLRCGPKPSDAIRFRRHNRNAKIAAGSSSEEYVQKGCSGMAHVRCINRVFRNQEIASRRVELATDPGNQSDVLSPGPTSSSAEFPSMDPEEMKLLWPLFSTWRCPLCRHNWSFPEFLLSKFQELRLLLHLGKDVKPVDLKEYSESIASVFRLAEVVALREYISPIREVTSKVTPSRIAETEEAYLGIQAAALEKLRRADGVPQGAAVISDAASQTQSKFPSGDQHFLNFGKGMSSSPQRGFDLNIPPQDASP